MWRIGTGKCMFDSKEKALRAYRGYLGSKGKSEASLDDPLPYQWRSRQSYGWVGKFAAPAHGPMYTFSATMEHDDLGEGYDEELWHVQFYADNHKYGITGTGDAQAIFATVIAMMSEFTRKIQPAVMMFEAKEVSRSKLYERLIKRYARSWGFDHIQRGNWTGEPGFILVNTRLQNIDWRERVASVMAELGLAVLGQVVALVDRMPGGIDDENLPPDFPKAETQRGKRSEL